MPSRNYLRCAEKQTGSYKCYLPSKNGGNNYNDSRSQRSACKKARLVTSHVKILLLSTSAAKEFFGKYCNDVDLHSCIMVEVK